MVSAPEVWLDFFEKYYSNEINRKIAEKGGFRYDGSPIIVNVSVRDTLILNYDLYRELMTNPDHVISHAVQGLKMTHNIYGVTLKEARVRFVNFPEHNRKLVKQIGASSVLTFVSVMGIVRRLGDSSSFVKYAEFVCPECGLSVPVAVRDDELKPLVDKCPDHKKKLIPNTKAVVRVPYRKITLQDLPEHLEANELPTFLEVWLFEDLVENIRAGDKVIVNGVVRSMLKQIEKKEAVERIYLEANSLEFIEKDFRTIKITREDEEKIKAIASNQNVYERLVQSIAPNVYGYDDIKLAIALQLFGGCKEEDRRGDIHILVIGDPGVSKSKLIREVAKIAPRAVLSTGYSTTGAGLTVSAIKDDEGKWNLEAGVLVLADKGIALIDEIEKMGKEDREHMLEALEQQTITVSKAGIHAVLNSRCAVLAVGNPKYGKFDRSSPLAEQIGLESNLLSRFDLIFVVLDEPSEDRDREITRFLLKNTKKEPPIHPDLLRKYIAYARDNIKRVELSDEVVKEIENFYISLRKRAREGVTITARQLEAIRRMTQAFAKIRLSNVALVEDAKRAIKLMEASLSTWAVDPETGAIDLIYGLMGIGAGTRDRIATLKLIINSLDSGNGARLEEVLAKAEENGISRVKAEQIIAKLREVGDIFFPRFGFVKVVK